MNAWLKRCVFNLDLNSERVSERRTLSWRLFQSLGAKYENAFVLSVACLLKMQDNHLAVHYNSPV